MYMEICIDLKLLILIIKMISLEVRYVRACACERYNVYCYKLHYAILIINKRKTTLR